MNPSEYLRVLDGRWDLRHHFQSLFPKLDDAARFYHACCQNEGAYAAEDSTRGLCGPWQGLPLKVWAASMGRGPESQQYRAVATMATSAGHQDHSHSTFFVAAGLVKTWRREPLRLLSSGDIRRERWVGVLRLYGGFNRESRDPLIPANEGDHWKRMLRSSRVSDLQETNASANARPRTRHSTRCQVQRVLSRDVIS